MDQLSPPAQRALAASAPPDLQRRLSQHPDPQVRRALLSNANRDPATVAALTNDPHPDIRAQAQGLQSWMASQQTTPTKQRRGMRRGRR